MSTADDAELMLHFQGERDYAAFEELFRRHKDVLLRFVLRLARNRAAAEDVSQQTWLKVIDVACKGTFSERSGGAFRSWLCTLARNHFIDEHRRKFVAARTAPLADDLLDASRMNDDSASGPFEQAEQGQFAQRLNVALRALPFEQREVIALWAADVNLDSMVAMIGAPRDTILSRKKYALAKLRAMFAAESAEPRT